MKEPESTKSSENPCHNLNLLQAALQRLVRTDAGTEDTCSQR